MIHILLAEDSEDDSLLIVSRLRNDGLEFTHERVDTAEAMRAALAAHPPDVVLSDYNMPHFSADAALEVVRAAGGDVPFILVSGAVGEDAAVGLMRAGAHDFVLKDRLARLAPAVQRELREAEDRRRHRRADAALRASEERFRLLAEHGQDVIFRYRSDPHPAVEYISSAVRLVTGHRPEEFYADPELIFTLVDPADRAPMRRSWNSARPQPLIVRWLRPDGSPAWTEQRAVSVRDRRGAVVAVEGSLRDVTAHTLDELRRHQLEQQLRQAERMETLGQLAGGIAHDFNNLLAMITGYADLAATALPGTDPIQGDLAGIRKAVDRGAGLIRQLLVFGRPDPVETETVDVNEIVADTVQLLRRTIGNSIEFVVDREPDLPPVTIERGKLEQILVNLIINARAAMPDGGRVTLRTSTTDTVPDGSPVPGRHVRIAVADTGTGMDAEVARRAFEPFFTTKGPVDGTGLGLATVHGAVTEAGGGIRLSSVPGEGTTFDLYFPATDEAGPDPRAEGVPGPGRTILLVEDDDAVRDVVARILRTAGYHVVDFATPAEALDRYGDGSASHVDALLTDYLMPGMTGDDMIDRLHAERPGLPVLLMSAYTPDRRLGREPAAVFLPKPFTSRALLGRLQELLDR